MYEVLFKLVVLPVVGYCYRHKESTGLAGLITGACIDALRQSQVENDHYSVAYFNCVTAFKVLYL